MLVRVVEVEAVSKRNLAIEHDLCWRRKLNSPAEGVAEDERVNGVVYLLLPSEA